MALSSYILLQAAHKDFEKVIFKYYLYSILTTVWQVFSVH